MRKITPFLWFESQADEAAQFYVSVFKNAKLLHSDAISASVELEGQELHLFNGGPHFKLSPAFSLFVNCESQTEIDGYWEKLTADGGKESQCGWLEDKYGVSWQIAPSILVKYLTDPDPVKAGRVRDVMMPMQKLDLAALQRAYNGA
jgi:predicted 3-demethylubiquinone-9 3-methyltransferase (glyoxalase superfamily)